MGLPIHGSQNMNHIRLINKLNYLKARYDYLLQSLRHSRKKNMKRNYYDIQCTTTTTHQRFGQESSKNIQQTSKLLKHRARNTLSSRFRTTTNTNVHKSSLSLPLKSSTHSSSKIHKQRLSNIKKAFPIISNMPFIHLNSSVILINTSPFALSDRRFGILHHHSPSLSYY